MYINNLGEIEARDVHKCFKNNLFFDVPSLVDEEITNKYDYDNESNKELFEKA